MKEILLECRPSALGCRYEVLFRKNLYSLSTWVAGLIFIFYCYLLLYVTYKNITLLSGLPYQDDYIFLVSLIIYIDLDISITLIYLCI